MVKSEINALVRMRILYTFVKVIVMYTHNIMKMAKVTPMVLFGSDVCGHLWLTGES